jgi:hypothetical protein
MKKLLSILLFLPLFAKGQIITTVGGGGSSLSDGVPATSANIHSTLGGAFDSQGNYYFGEGAGFSIVRKIDTAGNIFTVAGSTVGFSGDGGQATIAQLNGVEGISIDINNNIYIADLYNARVRKVTSSTGIITTYAGNGIRTSVGNGIPATDASIVPESITTDAYGNIYVVDSSSIVRKIDTFGIITTVAGNGTIGYTGDGGQATSASISLAWGICCDVIGNVYIGCVGRIRKLDKITGIINTIAGNGNGLYIGDGMDASSAQFDPTYITIDASGNLYITNAGDRVFKIDTTNIFRTFAGNGSQGFSGDGGPATAALLYNPAGIVTDLCGNLYIADAANHRIRKVTYPHCEYEQVANNTITDKSILFYPNPTTTSLTISAKNKINAVSITNLLGQTISTDEYNTEQVQLNVADLPKGIYLLKINGTEIRKFLKE